MPSLNGLSILLVDDDRDFRLICRKILSGCGAELLEAQGVTQALEILRDKTPNIILLDLNMPERDGFDFLAHRKTDVAMSSIPTLVLTVKNDKESVVRAMNQGALGYILKPINSADFIKRLTGFIKNSRVSITFDEKTAPRMTIETTVEIVTVGEEGCNLTGKTRLTPHFPVHLRNRYLKDLDISRAVLVPHLDPKAVAESENLASSVRFVGLDHYTITKLRAKLGKLNAT